MEKLLMTCICSVQVSETTCHHSQILAQYLLPLVTLLQNLQIQIFVGLKFYLTPNQSQAIHAIYTENNLLIIHLFVDFYAPRNII